MKKIMKIGIFLTIFLVTYGQQNMTTDATTTDDEADDIVRKMTINILIETDTNVFLIIFYSNFL